MGRITNTSGQSFKSEPWGEIVGSAWMAIVARSFLAQRNSQSAIGNLRGH